MATKKKTAPNLYDELDAALSEWFDDLAYIPSRMMWGDLSAYYPPDALLGIEKELQFYYADLDAAYSEKCGNMYSRLAKDIRDKQVKAVLRKDYRRRYGDYSEKDKEAAWKLVDTQNIPWLRTCVYRVADIYACYGALDYIRPRLESCLPGNRPHGAPRDDLRRRMLRQVFLAVYEAFTGREFGWYPLTFKGERPSLMIPHKQPSLRVTITKGYLAAMVNILRMFGEKVSKKAMEKIRDKLRAELIIGPSKYSGLEPVRAFYQNHATKAEKAFLINWVLSIGLYKHPKAAARFLETPVISIVR
jgi:hypothetical protein